MKTISFAVSHASTNAIKTSIATVASPVTYSGAQINGAIGLTAMKPSRTLSVTTSSSVGSYVAGSKVTFTGTDDAGRVQTEVLSLTLTAGGETLVGSKGFASVTSITIESQANTSGAFTFGVQDLCIPGGLIQIRALAAGDLHVGYADGTTDLIKSLNAKEYCPISPTKIFGDATTTVVGMTLFYK